MNYNNVKSPFDIYDENKSNEELNSNTATKRAGKANGDEKSVNNTLAIILYAIVMMMAIIGILSLILPSVRNALFSAIFGL